MKKYTKEEMEQTPDTLVKFFVLQGKAELSMIEDAFIFYKTFGRHKNIQKKAFTNKFLRSSNFYLANKDNK